MPASNRKLPICSLEWDPRTVGRQEGAIYMRLRKSHSGISLKSGSGCLAATSIGGGSGGRSLAAAGGRMPTPFHGYDGALHGIGQQWRCFGEAAAGPFSSQPSGPRRKICLFRGQDIRILEKQNWLQMSQVFSCVRRCSMRWF
jgi:hypothetical protein